MYSMLSLLMAVGVSLSRSEKYDLSCFLVSNLWYAWSYCWISQKTKKKKKTSLACLTQLTSQPVCLSCLISALVIFSTITSITALHI